MPLAMPSAYGLLRADAEKELRGAGIRGPIAHEMLIEQTLGRVDFAHFTVCSQSPEPDERTTTDRRVVLLYCDPDRVLPLLNTPVLTGRSVEEARRLARREGLAGRIVVTPLNEFDPTCKAATVCRIHPLRWNVYSRGGMTLYINRPITITTPN